MSGTLWSGQVARLQYASESLTQLRWELNGWSLLRLPLKCPCALASAAASTGRGGWLERRRLWPRHHPQRAGPWLLARVPMQLPVPVTVAGQLQLKLDQVAQGSPWCDNLYGNLYWYGADADTPPASWCWGIRDQADLHRLPAGGRAQAGLGGGAGARQAGAAGQSPVPVQGTLKPGPELPEQMKQGLPFLGQPDGQGRFPLRYQGRI